MRSEVAAASRCGCDSAVVPAFCYQWWFVKRGHDQRGGTRMARDSEDIVEGHRRELSVAAHRGLQTTSSMAWLRRYSVTSEVGDSGSTDGKWLGDELHGGGAQWVALQPLLRLGRWQRR
jgi:hypothetical protein